MTAGPTASGRHRDHSRPTRAFLAALAAPVVADRAHREPRRLVGPVVRSGRSDPAVGRRGHHHRGRHWSCRGAASPSGRRSTSTCSGAATPWSPSRSRGTRSSASTSCTASASWSSTCGSCGLRRRHRIGAATRLVGSGGRGDARHVACPSGGGIAAPRSQRSTDRRVPRRWFLLLVRSRRPAGACGGSVHDPGRFRPRSRRCSSARRRRPSSTPGSSGGASCARSGSPCSSQIATNFANDYSDGKRGTDDPSHTGRTAATGRQRPRLGRRGQAGHPDLLRRHRAVRAAPGASGSTGG